MSTVEVPSMAERALTADDRCDRCGAQAYVITQHGAGELLWCAHHAREHGEKLDARKVIDLTSKLVSERPLRDDRR